MSRPGFGVTHRDFGVIDLPPRKGGNSGRTRRLSGATILYIPELYFLFVTSAVRTLVTDHYSSGQGNFVSRPPCTQGCPWSPNWGPATKSPEELFLRLIRRLPCLGPSLPPHYDCHRRRLLSPAAHRTGSSRERERAWSLCLCEVGGRFFATRSSLPKPTLSTHVRFFFIDNPPSASSSPRFASRHRGKRQYPPSGICGVCVHSIQLKRAP